MTPRTYRPTKPFRMPLGSLSRESILRGVAVFVITGAVTLAAACSDEDTVDTIPPPRPGHTTSVDGPQGVPAPETTSTETPTVPDPSSTTSTN